MDVNAWGTTITAISAAFLASLVEVVEAFTIILAVGIVRGWRSTLLGAGVALVLLFAIVLTLGPLLDKIPLHLLQFVIGALLLLFGLRWLRKAILRAAGYIALHDEAAAFFKEATQLRSTAQQRQSRIDWLAGTTAFKAVTLEGLEVVFIVVAVGSGRGLLIPASLGALGACVLVTLVGVVVHKPLSRVPENTLKFAVGVMLAAFGVFWTGEGLGVEWPGGDLALVAFVFMFLGISLALIRLLQRPSMGVLR